jgi:dolichol kinase
MGDVNRKSIAGTVAGFVASLGLCLSVALAHQLPAPWLVLAFVISSSTTLVELLSPRGTDDFTMATTNALICVAFGMLI